MGRALVREHRVITDRQNLDVFVSDSAGFGTEASETATEDPGGGLLGSDTFTLTESAAAGSAIYTNTFESAQGLAYTEGGVARVTNTNRVTLATANPRTGSQHVRFTFNAAADCADSPLAEYRFTLGQLVSEVWFERWIYLPSNYTVRTQASCPSGSRPTNNKFFRIWYGNEADGQNGYSQYYHKMGMSWQNYGNIEIRPEYGRSGKSVGIYGRPGWSSINLTPYVGRYSQWRFYFRTADLPANNNGIIQMSVDGVTKINVTDLDVAPTDGDTTKNYWKFFYIWGADNSGFTEETLVDEDDFTVYLSDPGWTF